MACFSFSPSSSPPFSFYTSFSLLFSKQLSSSSSSICKGCCGSETYIPSSQRLTQYSWCIHLPPGNSRNSRQLGAFCSQRLSNGRSVDSSLRWLYVELKADDADSKGRFLFTYEAVQPQLSTTLGEKHAARTHTHVHACMHTPAHASHTHTGSLTPSLTLLNHTCNIAFSSS